MRHFFGIPDEEFIRGDVPMTKCEIRKAVMNEARIEEDSIVLDVGAGTGSCLLYTSPSPRDRSVSRMPSSA